MPKEKAGTLAGSAVANTGALVLRLPQGNVLECETYKMCKSKKTKVHKTTQTDP